MAFNELTDAEIERLAIVAEEAAESIKEIGKILRHGYESRHPSDLTGPTNRDNLIKELGDLTFAIGQLLAHKDIDSNAYIVAICDKAQRIKPYVHHTEVRS